MHVAVLGAGTIGRDIAHVCALAGHGVTVRDVDPDAFGEARTQVADNLLGGAERGKLTDVVGLDVRLDILEYPREEIGERFRPSQVLRRKVRAGTLGRKTRAGFYVREDGEAVRPVGE